MTNSRKGTIAILLAAGIAALLQTALASAAGLSSSPAILEHGANAGSVGSVTVTNTTSGKLEIRLSARPWIQALSGNVAPNGKATLSDVKLSSSSFTLNAGASRSVSVSYNGKGTGGSQYGCIEVVGTPQSASKHGVTVDYRLISTLRLNPKHKSLKATLVGLAEVGKGSHRSLAITLKNTGNTVEPLGGSVRLKGPRGTYTDSVPATRIVPGQSIRLTLQSLAKVPKGTYSASVQITQDGHTVLRSSKSLELP